MLSKNSNDSIENRISTRINRNHLFDCNLYSRFLKTFNEN